MTEVEVTEVSESSEDVPMLQMRDVTKTKASHYGRQPNKAEAAPKQQWPVTFEGGQLRIHYDKYHDVVGKMLNRVLEVQYEGDKAAADKFIDQYTTWDENLHGLIAKNIRDQQRYRFRLFNYAALGE